MSINSHTGPNLQQSHDLSPSVQYSRAALMHLKESSQSPERENMNIHDMMAIGGHKSSNNSAGLKLGSK